MSIEPFVQPNILIRDARDTDFDAIAHIYSHYVLHTLANFEEIPPTADELLSRCREIRESGLPYLVAELSSEPNLPLIVGYTYARPFHTRPAYRYTIENSIYVAHDRRGCGVGKALLRALLDRCAEGPWKQMIAVMGDPDSPTSSMRLHESFGFRNVSRMSEVGFKFGKWVDTGSMQRTIKEENTAVTSALAVDKEASSAP